VIQWHGGTKAPVRPPFSEFPSVHDRPFSPPGAFSFGTSSLAFRPVAPALKAPKRLEKRAQTSPHRLQQEVIRACIRPGGRRSIVWIGALLHLLAAEKLPHYAGSDTS